jgi:cell division protein FtsW (lipid II flippase)
MSFVTRQRLGDLHWPLIIVTAFIALLGVYNLHSAAAARDPELYLKQLSWMALAAAMVVIFLFADYRVTEGIAYPFYALVCVLLLAVLVQGKHAKGAERWLELGPLTFQPSELAKIGMVLCLARYFSQRVEPDGYTLGSLLRPLNLSRPLAVVGGLTVFWSKPYLADPAGTLARFVHGALGKSPPPLEDLLWFRVLLLVSVVAAVALAIIAIVRWEQRVALLAPWPPGRRRRLIAAAVMAGLACVLAVALVWSNPVVRDPIGVAVAWLHWAGAPQGPLGTPQSSLGLRLVLLLGAALYLGAGILTLRRGAATPLDLFIAPIDVVLFPALLILVQPDLGTAGVVILIGMTMVLIVGVRLRSLVILGFLGAFIAAIGWFGVLKDYQKSRILTFLDPEHDLQGAGWNAVQSMIAVGSGRWFGKGHMGGTQTQLSFLPEQHTDFAFSVWSEEQGFFGCFVLITLYFLLISFALTIASEARERYGALLSAGCAAIVLWQALINMGMVIGVFPVVGITLPLFSYGGSSVLTVVLALGILLNVHWRRRAH